MASEFDDCDLREMRVVAKMARDSGFRSVQIDAEHAIALIEEVLRLRSTAPSIAELVGRAKEETRDAIVGRLRQRALEHVCGDGDTVVRDALDAAADDIAKDPPP